MSAPFVSAKVKEVKLDASEEALMRPWQPTDASVYISWEPPGVGAKKQQQHRTKREQLAASAQVRYDEWKAKQGTLSTHALSTASVPSPHFPKFRDRNKRLELAGEWVSADQVLTAHDRVEQAEAVASAAFLQGPPYPKQGGGVKNVEFSYMSAVYDYRRRQPSLEVSGDSSIMRTRPRTESARINEVVASQRMHDSIGGSRWSVDHRYGNPPTFTPQTTGDTFRQASPYKWLGSESPGPASPPQTGASTPHKWRGGFANSFPPRTGTAHGQPIADGATPWMHHTIPFEDRFNDAVAMHIPESIRRGGPSYRPRREKGKELTGPDGAAQFWPQYTGSELLPNPSATCTWNVQTPPSPLPSRTYPKTGHGSPGGMDVGSQLISASQIEASGVLASGSG